EVEGRGRHGRARISAAPSCPETCCSCCILRTGMGRRLAAACVLAALAAVPAAASAGSSSLYHGPVPRPGPSLLYAPPAYARHLSNAGPWPAKSILFLVATSNR